MYRHDPAHTGYTTSKAPTTSAIQLWNYTTGGRVDSSPAVANGYVYVGSEDGNVFCLDASTGAQIWSYTQSAESPIYWGSPVVVGDYVYIGCSNGDNNVYCFTASHGTKIWNYTTNPSSDPAVANGYVYVGSWTDDNLYCLDAYTGAKIWNYLTVNRAGMPPSSPAVVSGDIYVGAGDYVYCLDAYTGAKIWNYTNGGTVYYSFSSPAVVNGYVYVGSHDGNVYCLDASTGAKVWNYTTAWNNNGPAHGYHWGNAVGNPAVAYGCVYVGSSDFDVFCLNASNGAKVWNYTTGAEVYFSPAVADRCVYVGSYDGNVYCLNASNGAKVWSYPAGIFSPTNIAGGAGSPAVAGGVVYVVGNGILYALGAPSTTPSLTTIVIVLVVVLVIVAVAVSFVYSKFTRGKKADPSSALSPAPPSTPPQP